MKVIREKTWHTQNLFCNPSIEAKTEHFDEFSIITLNDTGYSISRIVCDIEKIKSNFYYDIKVDTEADGKDIQVDILEVFYDNDNKELLCQYVKSPRPSLSPNGAARLEVYVLVRGKSYGTVKVFLPEVTEIKPYEKRPVTLAAITIDKNSVKDRPREVIDNFNDAIAKIDMLCNSFNKPDIVLFTETFHTTGVKYSNVSDSFIALDSEYIAMLRKKAREYGIYICFSMKEIDKDGYFYNSAPLIDRNGNIVLNYHKTHLTMTELSAGLMPGDDIAIYDADFGRVGIAICWDMFFNDYINILRDNNVEIILNPSHGYWDDINSMRAEDSGAYILTAGSIPEKTAIIRPEGNYDREKCVDYGNIIERGDFDGNNGMVIATIDLNERFPAIYLSSDSTAERSNVYKNEARQDIYKKYRS